MNDGNIGLADETTHVWQTGHFLITELSNQVLTQNEWKMCPHSKDETAGGVLISPSGTS
jgi:hypothetical protein